MGADNMLILILPAITRLCYTDKLEVRLHLCRKAASKNLKFRRRRHTTGLKIKMETLLVEKQTATQWNLFRPKGVSLGTLWLS
jgi:hypothetical protein